MTQQAQVVIVGGGPVGVGLAVDLGRRGISCIVVESRTELSAIPKGQGLNQRTLETLYNWGVADQIRAARTMPPGYKIGQITAYESLMGEYWASPPGREVIRDYYFQANERLPQYRTEGVLRKRLDDFAHVTSLWGWRATSLEQDAEGVRVTIEKDGATEVLEAEYVVGCDGGHSMVRTMADIERQGTNWGEVVALVVFRSKELHQALNRFPDASTFRVMHPDLEGYWMFLGRVDVGESFFFHAPIPTGADPATVDPASLLHRMAGFQFELEVDHLGFWDLRVQVAQSYRSGRAFIAGDAAHTHPPYGGFGLNNGLEDAVNLGWKLTAALVGWGGDALLDSYSLERQPVFRDVGEDMIGGMIREDREFLQTHSPKVDGERFQEHFEYSAGSMARRVRDFEPNYEGSPIVFGPEGGVTSAHGSHSFVARVGHHLPPRELSSGRNVFEELGTGFTLVALDVEDVDGFERAAQACGVPLVVVRDSYAGGREAYGARLVLVRPDQFIAWVGDELPDDPTAVIETVVGRR